MIGGQRFRRVPTGLLAILVALFLFMAGAWLIWTLVGGDARPGEDVASEPAPEPEQSPPLQGPVHRLELTPPPANDPETTQDSDPHAPAPEATWFGQSSIFE